VANVDTISTIAKTRLEEVIASLSPAKLAALYNALCYALGLR
jgi:mRNA-degrading endonuclease toxin of MazEF toxin-antitoxin module